MERNVAIVGYKQTKHMEKSEVSRERMMYELVQSLFKELGITQDDIDTFVMCSNDFQDGRTISEVYMIPWVGAYMKDQTKVDSDGANACIYGLMRILSGNYNTALIIGYGMGGSEFRNQLIMNYILDPLYERQLGLINEISAAALQAKSYMNKFGLTEEQLAKIASKALRNSAKNENALRRDSDVTSDAVLNSRPLYLPIRELHTYPPTDGGCVVLLAAEERAKELTDSPVWIRGAANCQETYYIGERDLTRSESVRMAGEKAYKMAGIKDPSKDIDLAELSTKFASEEPIFSDALGLSEEGSGGNVIEEGLSEIDGSMPVNPSGGPLGANPFTACGLIRIIEAARQLRGEAGDNQVKDPKTAIAHGQIGICAQHNAVLVLGI